MARHKDYSRLGFFLILSILLVTATMLFFLSKNNRGQRIPLVTFFEEPVTGLDAGATILLKGVKVGQVGKIAIDAESGYVRVELDIDDHALRGIGVFSPEDLEQRIRNGTVVIPENLRVKILRNPLVGTARLLIDTYANPPKPLALGRKPKRAYIASIPSPESSFFTSLEKVTVQVPAMLDQTNAILARIDKVLGRAKLDVLIDESIDLVQSSREQIEVVGGDLHAILDQKGSLNTLVAQASADLAAMRQSLQRFLDLSEEEIQKAKIAETSAKIRGVLDSMDRLGGSGDLLASDLREVIPTLEAMLVEITALARVLREQPDSLLYGRKKTGTRKQ